MRYILLILAISFPSWAFASLSLLFLDIDNRENPTFGEALETEIREMMRRTPLVTLIDREKVKQYEYDRKKKSFKFTLKDKEVIAKKLKADLVFSVKLKPSALLVKRVVWLPWKEDVSVQYFAEVSIFDARQSNFLYAGTFMREVVFKTSYFTRYTKLSQIDLVHMNVMTKKGVNGIVEDLEYQLQSLLDEDLGKPEVDGKSAVIQKK